MTFDEAMKLNKGDNINYNNSKYTVLHIKECRNAHTGEKYARIKCVRKSSKRGIQTLWMASILMNYMIERRKLLWDLKNMNIW